MCDAAFPGTIRLVPTYKKRQTANFENVVFNRLLSSIRVKMEHVNGLGQNNISMFSRKWTEFDPTNRHGKICQRYCDWVHFTKYSFGPCRWIMELQKMFLFIFGILRLRNVRQLAD